METVYFFGAGATKALIGSAPLMRDLLPEALKEMDKPNHPGHERAQRISRFVNEYYFYRPASSSIDPKELPPFEDMLSQIDLALEASRPFSKSYTLPALAQLREDLIYAICEVLRHTLGRGAFAIAPEAGVLLLQLVGTLHPKDSLVSLNYDLVLDNALLEHRRLRGRPKYSYGVPVRFNVMRPRRHHDIAEDDTAIPLLKLHGSLNWVYCPVCQSLDITGDVKGLYYLWKESGFGNEGSVLSCPKCGGAYDPLIITPTLVKVYRNELLQQVWRGAENRLARADRVVFIGYSLPDADIHIRCMLKRALFRNHMARVEAGRGDNSCSITVVDMAPPPNPTFDRYRQLFGEIEYVPDGFIEYLQSMQYSPDVQGR